MDLVAGEGRELGEVVAGAEDGAGTAEDEDLGLVGASALPIWGLGEPGMGIVYTAIF